ncbi:MAG: putative lipid II flippase FtsW [Deltaproteobacteria bacterium]|jgi:cell division protein FtsW|nr:putative lipid II flippase FtsW [Deltaproteobacteria bacterium]
MDNCDYQRVHIDSWLLFCVIFLVGIGVTMNYSASAVFSEERFGDSYYFLKRTLIFSLIGFSVMTVGIRLSYWRYKNFVYFILAGALFLVAAVFIPGLGRTISGANRWVQVGPVTFQPSEAAKVAMIIFLAYSLEKKSKRIKSFTVGFMPHVLFMSVVAASILYQRDFGSAATIAAITWVMMFVAGVRIPYLLGMFFGLLPMAYMLISGSEYRKQRILAFLNPWSDQYGSGFQMIQSFVAFNEGGWFGLGLGQGQQKLFFLPEAHTDFIFSVIGEELGLLGVGFVIALFGFFCYRGFKISLDAPDLFGRYLAVGCTLLIGLEALLNMGVVMGLLPTKGLTLPFISYGGSSLVVSLLAVGILLNISTYKRVDNAW